MRTKLKLYLVSLLVTLFFVAGTTDTWAATSRRTATNENVSTGGNNTRDYDLTNGELSNWEEATDIDLVSATQSEVLEAYDDAASFDDHDYLNGATTNADYFRIIRPASGQGHDGTENNGATFATAAKATADAFIIWEDYSQIQDLIFNFTFNTVTTGGICTIYDCDHAAYVGCIVHGASNSSTGVVFSFRAVNNDPTGYFINCLSNDCSDTQCRCFCSGNNSDATVYWYNCSSVNGNYGFIVYGAGADGYMKNCLVENPATGSIWRSGNLVITNCAESGANLDDDWTDVTKACSSAADATEANKLKDADGDFVNNGVKVGMRVKNTTDTTWANVTAVAAGELTLDADIFVDTESYEVGTVYISATFTFENGAGDDYHLASNDAGGIDKGTDLSGDGTFAFDDDIDGDTRSGTWDIGFDEYVAAGVTMPIFDHYYRQH